MHVMTQDVSAANSATTTLEGVPAGSYVLRLQDSRGDLFAQPAIATAGEYTEVHATFNAFLLYGTVRRAGKPVQARLLFATGEAPSDAFTGAFTAALRRDPLANAVLVQPCDGGSPYRHIVDVAPTAGSTMDIEIPDRQLVVSVRSTTGERVAGATVEYTPMKNERTDYYTAPAQRSDATGAVVFSQVPGRRLRICATHDDYEGQCAEVDARRDRETITLTMRRQAAFRGRILAPGATGFLTWVASTGIATEEVAVTDGEFLYRQPHSANEYVIFTSPNYPLHVLRGVPPNDDGSPWEITLPTLPIRSVTVTLAADCSQEAGIIGLWIGGRYIPLNTLVNHQQFHGNDVEVSRGGSLSVPAIATAEPIALALGPDLDKMPPGQELGDPLASVAYASVPRVVVPPTNLVTLCSRTARVVF